MPALTDLEAGVLAVVHRQDGITAYQVLKTFERSPVAALAASKGGVYPAITRLQARGLVETFAVSGDRRGSERLSCTAAGAEAVKGWVYDVDDADLMPADPLRTKILSLHLLTSDEQIEWLLDTKLKLAAKLKEIEDYDASVEIGFQQFIKEQMLASVHAKMHWLDKLMYHILKEKRAAVAT